MDLSNNGRPLTGTYAAALSWNRYALDAVATGAWGLEAQG